MTEEDKPAENVKEKVEELAEAKDTTEPVEAEKTISESLRLKQENDALEEQIRRKEELKARATRGAVADAGTQEKSVEQVAVEEAAKILSPFMDKIPDK